MEEEKQKPPELKKRGPPPGLTPVSIERAREIAGEYNKHMREAVKQVRKEYDVRLNDTLRLTETELGVARDSTGNPYAHPQTLTEYRAALLAAVTQVETADTIFERHGAGVALHLLGQVRVKGSR